MRREQKMRLLPWLLIVIGFLMLSQFDGFISITCFVIAITMLIERKWPEKWGSEAIEV